MVWIQLDLTVIQKQYAAEYYETWLQEEAEDFKVIQCFQTLWQSFTNFVIQFHYWSFVIFVQEFTRCYCSIALHQLQHLKQTHNLLFQFASFLAKLNLWVLLLGQANDYIFWIELIWFLSRYHTRSPLRFQLVLNHQGQFHWTILQKMARSNCSLTH